MQMKEEGQINILLWIGFAVQFTVREPHVYNCHQENLIVLQVKLSILFSTVIHLTNIYHFHKAINGSTEEPNGQHFSNTVSEKQSLFCFELLGN